jgi:hypothetical protein
MWRQLLSIFVLLFILLEGLYAKPFSTKIVNIAHPSWGTIITSSSSFSSDNSAYNLIDGLFGRGNSWLSSDNAPFPQSVTFSFEEPVALTQIVLYQSTWMGSMYHTKDFFIEGSTDGNNYTLITSGELPSASNAKWSFETDNTKYSGIRVVITSGFTTVQSCGLGEVQLMARIPNNREPLHNRISNTIDWETFRGQFKMNFTLDPAAGPWIFYPDRDDSTPSGRYISGAYELIISESFPDTLASIVRWDIKRKDGQPFKVKENTITCKTSYSSVYKLFTPHRMSQQNYNIDLPFSFNHVTTVHDNHPVVWMQDPEGKNSLTLGMMDQISQTVIEGSTYDTANGGEAPGIANSYVRVSFHRNLYEQGNSITQYSDGLYINANSDKQWFDALGAYSKAVDKENAFAPRKISEWAMNPMWHSWYAHADDIDEVKIRKDAFLAKQLGFTTIQIDAGWNIPIGQSYSFENEGDYYFSDRFPNGKEMIQEMHNSGQRVILHVAPLIMGNNAKAWSDMKECLIKVNGKNTSYLDPRLKKVQDYLVSSWDYLFRNYNVDGLWYDFLEFPNNADQPDFSRDLISDDIYSAYSMLMQSLYDKAMEINPDAVIILRRPYANLSAKNYSTHAWPMDVPQDFHMNRRDVLFLKTLGDGILTHACCTSWAISESDLNVARQMSSITFAGVPALSSILQDSPPTHNIIIKKWLEFYEENKKDLILGKMTPLLPTPPSAAIKIESNQKTFFGFFEAIPGLIEAPLQSDTIIIVNAFKNRTNTRIEGIRKGTWKSQVFDHFLNPTSSSLHITDETGGINLNIHGKDACHTIRLTWVEAVD